MERGGKENECLKDTTLGHIYILAWGKEERSKQNQKIDVGGNDKGENHPE